MEYLRRNSGKIAEFLARNSLCSWDEKSRKREKKNPTPPRNLLDRVGILTLFDGDFYCKDFFNVVILIKYK